MTIDMTRHQGDNGLPLIECCDTRLQKYRVRTDFQPYVDPETEEQRGVTFIETEFPYKPTIAEVKTFVIGVIDAQTDEKILNGYEWTVLHGDDSGAHAGETVKVWLSDENQGNFKEAHRLASIDASRIIPVRFKISEDEGKKAVYETFHSFEELNAFYLGAFAYIKGLLDEGWQKKDSFDWSEYEQALNPETEHEGV